MNSTTEARPTGQRFNSMSRAFLTGVRILIGWHFLYEGVAKLFADKWSSAGFLNQSDWLLSDTFHWIASNPTALQVVNLLNVWGLILIGLALFMGLFTRLAGAAGVLLLGLYYIASPAFIGSPGENIGGGHFLIVNMNLIEAAALGLLIFAPRQMLHSIDGLLACLKERRNSDPQTRDEMRRSFLKDLAALPILGGFGYALLKKKPWQSFEEKTLADKIASTAKPDTVSSASPAAASFPTLKDLKAKSPAGKIGNLSISRLICGGNLISSFAHSRDLIYVSSLLKTYFTDEKVLETLYMCESCGVNTAILRVDKHTLRIINKYRKLGGKIQWIAQCKIHGKDGNGDFNLAIDNGAVGAFVHGGVADSFVARGRVDELGEAVAYMKKNNLVAGIGGHMLQVPIACEKAGLDNDFYMKTLNSGNYWTAGPKLIEDSDWKPDPTKVVEPELARAVKDNIWSTTPRQTVEFMKTVTKPWIAYKVLGAGAIRPKDGFKYAFESGADFACVGMFDFQVVEDCNVLNEVLAGKLKRTRVWA
ncbi:MAG: DoxX family protein [Phycisphaerae bacterium]|jgi:uncharacterized membrane protein YphA (DoxX/SURF4 family)|nr:DoxX family protein [Phycisphaerae bacterium]